MTIAVRSPVYDTQDEAMAWADAFSSDPVNATGYGVYGSRVVPVFVCTECDAVHATIEAAGLCHWGIAGVLDGWQATCIRGSTCD